MDVKSNDVINHVIMTALPPTSGHMDLIEFASRVGDPKALIVHMMFNDDEPFQTERYMAVYWATRHIQHCIVEIRKATYPITYPQTPEEALSDHAFWSQWIRLMGLNAIDGRPWMRDGHNYSNYTNNLVGSEMYCEELAKRMSGKFVQYDIERFTNEISGAKVRENLRRASDRSLFDDASHQPIPQFLRETGLSFVMFGAESVGKTTATKAMAKVYQTRAFPEWARPYLERVGPEVTALKMRDIVEAQSVIDNTALWYPSYMTFQDTDLLSTIGYYRLYSELMEDRGYEQALKSYMRNDRRIYFLLKSDIPFERDPLRYGGDVRETEDQYWIDLLEEFGCRYVVIENKDDSPHHTYRSKTSTFDQLIEAVDTLVDEHYAPIANYQRRS